jgi:hypothetical protein
MAGTTRTNCKAGEGEREKGFDDDRGQRALIP